MWKFEVNWNRKLAAKGWATSAFACEMIRSAVVGNFVNVALCKSGRLGPWPNLNDILAMQVGGEPLEGFCGDETGRLTWSLVRIADNGEWNR